MFVFYMNCVSAHQLPLAKEIVNLVGRDNFLYVDAGEQGQPFQTITNYVDVPIKRISDVGYDFVKNCDVLFSGMRDMELFECRCKTGLMTFYTSERWFKPIRLPRFFPLSLRNNFRFPGYLRMMFSKYRDMSRRVTKLLEENKNFIYLPIGIWAARDMSKILKRQFIDKEKWSPAEKIECLPNSYMWGDFVTPSTENLNHPMKNDNYERKDGIKLLWVGRMIDWKRIDVIIKAVAMFLRRGGRVSVTIVGDGPEKEVLKKMSRGLPVVFCPSVPMDKVRKLMREHDIYVLSSDEGEGWGAVVLEALEEGICCVGTYEAGASATVLPRSRLYCAGDFKALVSSLDNIIREGCVSWGIGKWTPKYGAERLVALSKRKEKKQF